MQRLSVRWSARDKSVNDFQAVVIGSGYGAAVAARKLSSEGWQVTVLERGSEYLPGDFPNDLGTAAAFFGSATDGNVAGNASGIYELRTGEDVLGLVGNGLGGGSLVNAGVLYTPTKSVFEQTQWPLQIRSNARDMMRRLNDTKDRMAGSVFDLLYR